MWCTGLNAADESVNPVATVIISGARVRDRDAALEPAAVATSRPGRRTPKLRRRNSGRVLPRALRRSGLRRRRGDVVKRSGAMS
jgi:hypothetical protein